MVKLLYAEQDKLSTHLRWPCEPNSRLEYVISNISVKEEGQIGEIEEVIIHPLYTHATAYNDIAVIKIRPNRGNSKFFNYIVISDVSSQ